MLCAVGSVSGMPELKDRLHADLNTAMKARDELTTATLRMALTAVTTEEVAGKQARELSDDEVLRVLTREAKKRREAAEAFDRRGRAELAERERAEGERARRATCPPQLTDDELAELVAAAVAETGATEPREMGAVMKLVQPRVAGRADGKRVSDEVRRQLRRLTAERVGRPLPVARRRCRSPLPPPRPPPLPPLLVPPPPPRAGARAAASGWSASSRSCPAAAAVT